MSRNVSVTPSFCMHLFRPAIPTLRGIPIKRDEILTSSSAMASIGVPLLFLLPRLRPTSLIKRSPTSRPLLPPSLAIRSSVRPFARDVQIAISPKRLRGDSLLSPERERERERGPDPDLELFNFPNRARTHHPQTDRPTD